MQSEQPKYRIGMTVSACIWFGLFPLLQGGSYAHITYDKWIIMQILVSVTVLCFAADLICMYIVQRKGAGSPLTAFFSPLELFRTSIPLILASLLLFWTILSCRLSIYGPNFWWLGDTSRYEALASQLCYFALFTMFFFSRINLKPVLLSAAAAVTVFFVIVLLQRGNGNPLGLYPSGRSFARNPEFQGTVGNIDMGTGYLLLLTGLFLCSVLRLLLPSKGSGVSFRSNIRNLPLQSILLIGIYTVALVISVYLILTMEVQFGVISLAVLFLFTLLRFLPKKWRLPALILIIILVLLVVWF